MGRGAQVDHSILRRSSTKQSLINANRSMAVTRGFLYLALVQYALSLAFFASAGPARNLRASGSSDGTINLLSEKGYARIMPLESHVSNSSRSLAESLGRANMVLTDDLLTRGYYTSTVYIGTPPNKFALIVDTGSTVTYVPCSTCTHCGTHQDSNFNPEASTSYEVISCTSTDCNTGLCGDKKQCKYERSYAEASTSAGVLGRDVFGFGDDANLGSSKLTFGCENDETGDLFYQKADGIMGLGRGPLSIVDQLVRDKDMANSFSLCYGGMSKTGGNMIMGDFPAPPAMVYTLSDPTRSPYYNVVLKQIKVAGTPLRVDESVFDKKYGTVLDSGTTYAYFPEQAFNEFKRAVISQLKDLQPVAGPDPEYQDVCYEGAGRDPSKLSQFFPSVELVFGDGQVLVLDPENYLFMHVSVPGAYCLGVFKNDNDHTTLLGGILVRNTLVKYDRANKRLGFWRTDCLDLWNRLDDAVNNRNQPPPPPPPSPPPPSPPPPSPPPVTIPPPSTVTEFDEGSITDGHIGGLELNISVVANYTTFRSLSAGFLEDMARDLQLEPHQVELRYIEEQGSNVSVTCTVSPPSTKSQLPGSAVKDIIDGLINHRVQFRSDFGTYELSTWKLIQDKRSSWFSKNIGLVVGLVVLVVAAGAVGSWSFYRSRDRTRRMRYVSVDPLGDDGPLI